MADSARQGDRDCWRSLLQAEDEATAARLVVQMAQERLCWPAVAFASSSHTPRPLLLVRLSDARGEDMGLILVGNLARPGLPPARARTAIELFAQLVSAALLSLRLRAGDLAARLSGDEFVALLPGTSPEAAAIVAQDLRDRVAALEPAFLPPGLRLSVSIGVAGTRGTQLSPEELLRAADAALYAAKMAGRNRVHAA